VQDDTEQRLVNVNFAVVLDETQSSKFVHEKIDAGPRGAIISASISCETLGSTF
jgi:hypothetical protein